MELAISVSSLLISVLVGLFIFLKNPKNATHLYFGLLVLFISFYPLVNYLAVNSPDNETAFLWSKIILLVSIPQGPLLYFFARVYPHKKFIFNLKQQIIIISWALINLVLAFSGLIFSNVEVVDKSVTIIPGPLVPSFALLHIGSIIAGLYVLYRKRKATFGQQRVQLNYVFFGILFSFTLTFLITIVLPVLFKNTVLLSISPIFLAISVVSVAYAIVSKRLFDIKTTVARSVAYILSLGFLAIVYSLTSSFVVNRLFEGIDNAEGAILINAGVFLIAVLAFPTIKNFFDKTTNRLFFRDSYDPQEFLDELNKSIVRNIEIGILLRHSTAVIENNLHTSFCQVALRDTEDVPTRVIGTKAGDYSSKELEILKTELSQITSRTIVTDELTDDRRELRSILQKHGIEVIVHLTESSYGNRQTIAFIIFGAKKSGNVYSTQDLRIIDIIADELVIAIQNALRFEEIQEFNVTLQKKVNDATSKLRKTNEKLKSMDETKDEFISMASHQLRTPLTSVKGYLSMVLEGDAGEINENQRKLLDQAFVSSQRMVYLIADLLNVSRLRTGKFIIDAHPTNLADVVESEISQLTEQAKAKNQTLTFEKPDDFPELVLDETKIRQVIMNFADNALFYTPSGGKIKIGLTTDRNHIYFTVKDNGIGVPKDEQKHMFTKFYRAKNARNARPDGTGLGLFMAKKVITAQGGNVLFESTEGKGSVFGFSFNKKHIAVPEDSNKTS